MDTDTPKEPTHRPTPGKSSRSEIVAWLVRRDADRLALRNKQILGGNWLERFLIRGDN